MADNIYGLKDIKNEGLVKEIRQKFLLEAENNKHLYHSIDIERCRSEDWQIERFLIEMETPDEALKALIKTMKWKKSYGIHEMTHQYFPREFALIFGHLKLSKDKQGHIIVWANSVKYRKISELNSLIEKYNTFFIESIDRMAGNGGYICVGDMTDATLASLDMSLSKFVNSLFNYYPLLIQSAITLNMSKIFTSAWSIMKSVMPKRIKDKYVFIKKEELRNHIDIDDNELPLIYGGNRENTYYVNDDMLPLLQCKHLGLSDNQIENFYKVYNFDK